MVFYCWDLKLLCTVKNLLHYSLTLKFHLCKEISVMHFILLLTLGPRWILDENWAASSCFQSGKTPLIFTMSFAYTKPAGFWHSTSNIVRYSQVFNQHKYMVLQCNNREDIKYSSDLHSKQKQKTTKIQKKKNPHQWSPFRESLWRRYHKSIEATSARMLLYFLFQCYLVHMADSQYLQLTLNK